MFLLLYFLTTYYLLIDEEKDGDKWHSKNFDLHQLLMVVVRCPSSLVLIFGISFFRLHSGRDLSRTFTWYCVFKQKS